MHVTRRSLSTARGPISYLTGGHGAPVLFLHGVPGSALAWTPVLEGLASEVTVVVPDLVGFGETPAPVPGGIGAIGLEAQAVAVAALLDALGVSSVLVVTHDFGGPVALRLFADRPDLFGGLVLSATNAFPDTPIPFPLSSIFWPVVGRAAAAAIFSPPSLALMLRTGAGSPDPKLDRSTYVGGQGQAAAIRTIFEHSLRNLRPVYAPLEAVLPTVDVPTAVIWGDQDPFFDVEHGRRTAVAIGAPFTVLPGAGHVLPAERPEAYLAAIESLRAAASKPT